MRRILIAVKQVGGLDEDYEPDGSASVPPDALDWALNEWDTFSLEAGLQLRDAGAFEELVVVTVGDEHAEEGLLECLAKGADRALRVWDPALAAADSLAVARTLAAVVERERPSLVLSGVQSGDTAEAATGVALAGYADLPRVAVVRRVTVDGDGLVVERELEGGVVEMLRVPTPCLLTIQTGINEPRYATLRAIKRAHEKPLEVLTLADLALAEPDVAAAQGASITRLIRPDRGAGAEMMTGDATDVAAHIATIIKERLQP
jgi:electron transfer flavoprotein beta subunit